MLTHHLVYRSGCPRQIDIHVMLEAILANVM
jgi:hypothetical protein